MSILYSSVSQSMAKTANVRRIGGVNKSQALPAGQQAGQVYLGTYRALNSTYPANMFSSAQKVTSLIPKIDFIKHLLLKIDHAVAGAPVTLVHSNYWFRQKDLRDSASGRIIQTQYDDSAQANMLNRLSAGREKAIMKTANIESAANGKYGLTKELPVGVHTFYVPVLASVFENWGGLYLNDLEGDLALDITTPSTIIASGAGTITTTITFMVEGADLNEADQKFYRDLYSRHAAECQFLMPVRTEFYSKVLTAGSANNYLPLNNVDGLCAYQMLMVRPVGTTGVNAGFAQWKLLNLGDYNGAAIDLVSSSGQSIWGKGAAIPTRYTRQHHSVDQFDNDWVSQKPVYFLNYSDSMNAALAGRIQGGYKFTSNDGDQIRLTLPSAPTSEVQTITFSSAPTATGYYSFRFRGEHSASILANSSVAIMKATIENMKSFSSKFVTVVCSGVASAGTSFSVTFTDPEGTLVEGDLLEVQTHDGLACSATTARTVAGLPGLATGSYDIAVYSYIYQVAGYTGKKLVSQLLLTQ